MQKWPKLLDDFWGFVKNIILTVTCFCDFLGNFWKKQGYFLFQQLVTLTTTCFFIFFAQCNENIKRQSFRFTTRDALTKTSQVYDVLKTMFRPERDATILTSLMQFKASLY